MGSWGEQYSAGDQGYDARYKFWADGMKKCVKCGADTTERTDCAGCRHNGDGYGTAVFTCSNTQCGWSTSFQYDEADGPYYYETRNWLMPGQEPKPPPPKPKEQFAAGDQSQPSRHRFWEAGMRHCISCDSVMRQERHVCGKRSGGDWGTAVFTCTKPKCSWKTSFRFDESTAVVWTEAKDWKKGVANFKVSQLGKWLKEIGLPHLVTPFENELIDGEILLTLKDAILRTEGKCYPKLQVSAEDARTLQAALTADEAKYERLDASRPGHFGAAPPAEVAEEGRPCCTC